MISAQASGVGQRRPAAASLALSVIVGALSIWTVLDRGWVPFDEGTIGLAAERVLAGALPHLDFNDPYTGGLAFLHAGAMRVFGVSLMAPRYALFAAFMLWLPAVWWLAARQCGVRWAAALTIVAAWWSLPIYPAAMPTWYLLFLGTWITAALQQWRSARRASWLVVVGALCGLAVLVKQTGLFLLAGALLGVLFMDQEDTRVRWTGGTPAGRTDAIIVLLLITLGGMVVALMAGRLGSGELLHLVTPIGGLLALAALREWRLTDNVRRRWRALGASTGIVLLSAAVPVALFVLLFVRHGALDALLDGTIGDGVRRLTSLSRGMRTAPALVAAAWPVYAVLLVEALAGRRRIVHIATWACGVALLAFAFTSVAGYRRLWFFATSVLPLASAAVAIAGFRGWRSPRPVDPVLLSLAGITALHALNQFPYSAPNYFGYVAPLAILTAGMVAAHCDALPRMRTAYLLLAGFGAFLRVGSVHNIGVYPAWWDYSHRLPGLRAGILVTAPDSVRYTRLLTLIERHRATGGVAAGPELPEVYFLGGAMSPGRDPYSLFSGVVSDSAGLPGAFDTAATRVIVIKTRPMFLAPLPADVHQWLADRYPGHASLDTLEVRWRVP